MKKGFTLMEVLITLGVVGIIAVLTLPNLVSNYRKRIFVASLQKVYNQLAHATKQIMNDERVDDLVFSSINDSADARGAFLKKYFEVVDDCGKITGSTSNNCFAESYKSLDGSKTAAPSINYNSYCVLLSTGASLCISENLEDDLENRHGQYQITTDVNGKTGPNVGGRDFFTFDLYSDGVIGIMYYEPNRKASRCQELAGDTISAQYGANCFGKVVADNWQMDY